MRIHLLSLPHYQTTWAYDLDGFNVMGIRFATLLKKLGHTVYFYASEENDAPCDELITVVTKAEQHAALAPGAYQHAVIEAHTPLSKLSIPRMITEIGKRKQPRDLICTIGGGSQQEVTAAHPELMPVEYSIGYVGSYSPYRVFQSEAWRHLTYGRFGFDMVRFFDTVIPGFFDITKFPVSATPGDYLVYVGRLVPRKGISVVCDVAKAAGVPLKFIGHGDTSLVTHGEYLGALHETERNAVVAGAKALICPTLYVEPYGCISPESQLSGVPVISTDCGGFTETVEHGKTGFRCRLFGEFVDAVGKVNQLDRGYIRRRARKLYSMETAARAYQAYFARLETLWGDGWKTTDFPVNDHALYRSHAQIQTRPTA